MVRSLRASPLFAGLAALAFLGFGCGSSSEPPAKNDGGQSDVHIQLDSNNNQWDGYVPQYDGSTTQQDGGNSGCSTVQDLIDNDGCTGQTCAVTNSAGDIGCVPPGTGEMYGACGDTSTTTGCQLGAGECFGTSQADMTCMPFCNLTSRICPNGGVCAAKTTTAQGEVGLCMMSDNCDGVAGTGCAQGEGCYFSGSATLCSPAGTLAEGAVCQGSSQCLPGYGCLGDGTTYNCMKWCRSNTDCTTGTCQGIGSLGVTGVGYCQ